MNKNISQFSQIVICVFQHKISRNLSRRAMIRYRSEVVLATIVFSSLLSLSVGGVETATHCDTLSFNASSPEGNLTLTLFDPSLGELVGVDLAVNLNVVQSFMLENEEPEESNVSVDSEYHLSITMPDTSSLSVNASGSISEELAGYDGEMDFRGQSGKTIEGMESKGSDKMKYTKLSDFVASSQNETVSLPATISTKSSVSGSASISRSTKAESELCVIYTYEPKAQ